MYIAVIFILLLLYSPLEY